MNRRRFKFATKRAGIAPAMLALAAALAAGCGAARPSKYYQLTVPPDAAPGADPAALPVTLLIGRLTSPPLYREDQIVYSSGGESMGTYEYHRWAEAPTEMIREILLRQLRASGRFRSVYMLSSNVRGDYVLHGHLYEFKGVEGTAARVTMELELHDLKTGTSVWTHFYSHDEPTSKKEIEAIVAALDHNVQQGIAEFRSSLDQYFSEHPPEKPAEQPKP